MQRLILEIWLALAAAAVIGGVVVWAVLRLWTSRVLARRDQVTMARLKTADESWAERLWNAEEDRDRMRAKLQLVDDRLAQALSRNDALEVRLREVGVDPGSVVEPSGKPALTVRIRSVGTEDTLKPPPELGMLPPPPESEAEAEPAFEAPSAAIEDVEEVEVLTPDSHPMPRSRDEPLEESAPQATAQALGEEGPLGDNDDLTRINGIGFGYAARLNALGYWRFDQIAEWDDAAIQRVAEALKAPARRIRAGNWVGQAQELALAAKES